MSSKIPHLQVIPFAKYVSDISCILTYELQMTFPVSKAMFADTEIIVFLEL